MHRMTGLKGLIALAAGTAVLALIALLPMFGSTGHTATPGYSLNRLANVSTFIIPGVPVTTLQNTSVTPSGMGTEQAPFTLRVPGCTTGLFPLSNTPTGNQTAELLVGKSEMLTYNSKVTQVPPNCATPDSFNITIRGLPKYNYRPTNSEDGAGANTCGDKIDNGPDGLTDAKDPECLTALKKGQSKGTRVQLATQLMRNLSGPGGADDINCNLTTAISGTASPTPASPIKIGCSAAAGFTGTDFISITHEATELNQSGEYMQYDQANVAGPCATLNTATELCIVARALQPGNNKYAHKANGTTQPCIDNNAIVCSPVGKTQIISEIHKHFQIKVKNNNRFFPTAPLLIYTLDASNNPVDQEIITYNNGATKVKPLGLISDHNTKCNAPIDQTAALCDELHGVSRGGSKALQQPTAVVAHPKGSIVTGAHAQLVCRAAAVQPGVDTNLATTVVEEPAGQVAGTSIANYPVCYVRLQPGDVPKTLSPKKLGVPIIASTLVILNGLGIPFLSTGGTPAGALQGTVIVDDNGPAAGCGPNDPQGIPAVAGCVLRISSPCVKNFTPGTNLFVDVQLTAGVKVKGGVATGQIKVTLDTIPEGPGLTHDTCDDPSGTDAISLAYYSGYNGTLSEDGAGPNTCSNGIDDPGGDTLADVLDPECYALYNGALTHDTDGDGCSDIEELNPKANLGGQRDPWNRGDFGDVNADGAIDVPNDILQIILAYNQASGGPNYTNAKDHGGAFGPFAWNRATRDNIIDVPNDILPAILQYNNSCKAAP